MKAIEADALGRAKDVQPEISFAMARKEDCSVCLAALREGEDRFLPTFDEPMRAARLAAWHEAVSRVRS